MHLDGAYPLVPNDLPALTCHTQEFAAIGSSGTPLMVAEHWMQAAEVIGPVTFVRCPQISLPIMSGQINHRRTLQIRETESSWTQTIEMTIIY